MNEQLQAALAELINKSLVGIDSAAGLVAVEIPDVIQQLLMWHGAYNFLMLLMGIAIAVAWFVAEVKAFKWFKELGSEEGWVYGYVMLGSILRVVPFMMTVVLINLKWLKIWIAPKVWLLEYASSLAK